MMIHKKYCLLGLILSVGAVSDLCAADRLTTPGPKESRSESQMGWGRVVAQVWASDPQTVITLVRAREGLAYKACATAREKVQEFYRSVSPHQRHGFRPFFRVANEFFNTMGVQARCHARMIAADVEREGIRDRRSPVVPEWGHKIEGLDVGERDFPDFVEPSIYDKVDEALCSSRVLSTVPDCREEIARSVQASMVPKYQELNDVACTDVKRSIGEIRRCTVDLDDELKVRWQAYCAWLEALEEAAKALSRTVEVRTDEDLFTASVAAMIKKRTAAHVKIAQRAQQRGQQAAVPLDPAAQERAKRAEQELLAADAASKSKKAQYAQAGGSVVSIPGKKDKKPGGAHPKKKKSAAALSAATTPEGAGAAGASQALLSDSDTSRETLPVREQKQVAHQELCLLQESQLAAAGDEVGDTQEENKLTFMKAKEGLRLVTTAPQELHARAAGFAEGLYYPCVILSGSNMSGACIVRAPGIGRVHVVSVNEVGQEAQDVCTGLWDCSDDMPSDQVAGGGRTFIYSTEGLRVDRAAMSESA